MDGIAAHGGIRDDEHATRRNCCGGARLGEEESRGKNVRSADDDRASSNLAFGGRAVPSSGYLPYLGRRRRVYPHHSRARARSPQAARVRVRPRVWRNHSRAVVGKEKLHAYGGEDSKGAGI